MPALIVLALHTGLRKASLQKLRWGESVDLENRRPVLGRAKNGEPIGSALTERAVDELKKLQNKEPGALLFGNRLGKPFNFDTLWERSCAAAGLGRRNFHQLRHGCGSALAAAGTSQAQIMTILGHRTLTASRRYMHRTPKISVASSIGCLAHDRRAVQTADPAAEKVLPRHRGSVARRRRSAARREALGRRGARTGGRRDEHVQKRPRGHQPQFDAVGAKLHYVMRRARGDTDTQAIDWLAQQAAERFL